MVGRPHPFAAGAVSRSSEPERMFQGVSGRLAARDLLVCMRLRYTPCRVVRSSMDGRSRRRPARRSVQLASLLRTWLLCVVAGCGSPPEPRAPELAPPGPLREGPHVPGSFEQAKHLANRLYRDHRVTLYCHCEYDRHRRIQPRSCGYVPRHRARRAARVEWEHLVAAYEFGAQRACWRQKPCSDSRGRSYGGRRCCRELDPEFRRMEADLQNLSPEIGELNADRNNFEFGEVEGEAREYGACDFEVDRRGHVAEAALDVRGDIARAYLYMHETYGPAALPLSPASLERFRAWHRADPPTAWERERDARISAIQGVGNPWLGR
jgi:deoxyribonuclease-1